MTETEARLLEAYGPLEMARLIEGFGGSWNGSRRSPKSAPRMTARRSYESTGGRSARSPIMRAVPLMGFRHDPESYSR
jgi:hypothetical protein